MEPGIDKWTLFEKLGYEPHSEGQHNLHASSARFKIATCGRRWGKSLSAGMEFTANLFIPDTTWWIVGPTYKLGEKEFRVVHHNIINKLKLGKYVKHSYNIQQGNMRIEMPWNTVLEVQSADKPDSLVGEALNGVIMSEAAKHKMATWDLYVRPGLSDRRGIAWFPSTPQGYNWYKGIWDLGQHPDFPEYESWRFPTWENLTMYPGGRQDPEILSVESTVSRNYFLQEIAAEFTAFEGKIYDEFDPQTHVKRIDYVPEWQHYWAWDFGWADPFVCLDIMVDPSDNVYVWREYQVSFKTTWEHGKILKDRPNPEGFHVDAIFADPRGADEIQTLALQNLHAYARSSEVGWKRGVEEVKRFMKLGPDGTPKLFIDPSCVNLIRQLTLLRAKEQKEGLNAKEGQHDFDDHGPDALRYFFVEKFILGAGTHLTDVYGYGNKQSEAATFFQNHSRVTLSGKSPF